MRGSLEMAGIQWHPGFYGAAEIEFSSNKKDLEFNQEYNLSKQPVRMDLLVVKRLTDTPMENEIGHLFRTYNVVEYKSPDDGLTIDDYFKVLGYACLYKGLGKTVDQIPAEELTVSIFREACPRGLFKKLSFLGMEIRRHYPGIYYLTGSRSLFRTQIVVIKELDKKAHSTFRILSRHVQEEDVKAFIKRAVRLTEPGDRENVDAVLQVSVSANRKTYETIRGGDDAMCDALRELMKDDYEKMKKELEEEMRAETEKMKAESERVKQETLLTMLKNLMETMKWTADQAMTAMKIPEADRSRLLAADSE